MKIAAIGDTHGVGFITPEADLFIHAGDMTAWGKWKELQRVGYSLADQYNDVILVPGNHCEAFFPMPRPELFGFPNNVHLLVDTVWEKNGLIFYGSPWTPVFDPAFAAYTAKEADLERIYRQMPGEIDVLITHGPPRGILDNGKGSIALREAIDRRVIHHHVFGHIHECGGRWMLQEREEGRRESVNVAALLPVKSPHKRSINITEEKTLIVPALPTCRDPYAFELAARAQ